MTASVPWNAEAMQGNKNWFDEECRRVIENKNKARLQMLQDETGDRVARYIEQRKKCKKLLRKKKREFDEQVVIKLEEKFRKKDVRELYKGLRKN